MLDRKGEFLDLKEVGLAQQAIDIDAQGMSSKLGVQTGAQTPEGVSMKGVSMSGFQLELLGELPIHRLDNLSYSVDTLGYRLGQLPVLVGTRHCHQADVI